jgi:zinc transporter
MVRSGEMEDVTDLADLKLLIGSRQAVTVRSGALAAVDELRQNLVSDRSLVTAVDLLGFMVSAMTNRTEVVIYNLTQEIDNVEDAVLEGGSVPPAQKLSELRRRIFRTRRQVNAAQQVLAPMTTDPALALDAEDRDTLDRASKYVDRYLGSLDECRSRLQMLDDQIDAQRSETMTRSSFHLTVVATVFLPLTFITGLLGMNVAGIPDQHNPYGFWLITGISVIISLLVWLLLRRRMQARYQSQYQEQNQYQTSAGNEKSGRLADAPFDPPSDIEGGRQDRSAGAEVGKPRPLSFSLIVGVHGFALLLALVLFYFHVVGVFDVIGEIYHGKKSLMVELGPQEFGKIALLGCFLALVVFHLVEAMMWGLFLRSMRLVSSITEGIYFAAASITTLGYGDVLLKYPWRHLSTLIAITGVLTFGCSTAFLFVVMQDVWMRHL